MKTKHGMGFGEKFHFWILYDIQKLWKENTIATNSSKLTLTRFISWFLLTSSLESSLDENLGSASLLKSFFDWSWTVLNSGPAFPNCFVNLVVTLRSTSYMVHMIEIAEFELADFQGLQACSNIHVFPCYFHAIKRCHLWSICLTATLDFIKCSSSW